MRPLRYRSFYVALGGLYIGALIYFTLTPHPPQAPDLPNVDKWEHLLAYGLLMSWFGQLAKERRLRAQLALSFIALGAGLELAQGAMALGRSMEFSDAAANALGVWLGHWVTQRGGGTVLQRLEGRG